MELFTCLDKRCSAENKALIARNKELMRDMATYNARMPITAERRRLLTCSYNNCYDEEMSALRNKQQLLDKMCRANGDVNVCRRSRTLRRKYRAKKSLSNFVKAINYAYLNK